MQRVVITGLGALTPIGNNVKDFWKSLLAGKSGAAKITKYNPEKFKTQFACELKGYDPQNYFERADIRKYDSYTQYALVSVNEAVEMAGLDLGKTDLTRAGVIWGTGNAGVETQEDGIREYLAGDGTPRFNPYYMPKVLANMASGIISMKYGFKGISYTAISACASANTALMDAMNYIRWGKADFMIAGSSEAPIVENVMAGFNALKALSTANNSAETSSRPFDVARDGFVMGEGAGAFILESLDHALSRNAAIIAEVAGAAMASDAYHLTATHPEGLGAIQAMNLALQDAKIAPENIDYLNAHATSTPHGDLSEMKAVADVFGKKAKVAISATKSMTGHLLGAAGAIEGVAAIKSVENNQIPPTINSNNIDPDIPTGLNIILNKPLEKKVKYAMSNAFGFGGHNAVVIFKSYE